MSIKAKAMTMNEIDEWFEAARKYHVPLNKIESKFKSLWNELRDVYILDDCHIFNEMFIDLLERRMYDVFYSCQISADDGLIQKCYKIDMDQFGYDIMQADDVLELLAIRNAKLVRRIDV